MTSYRVRVRARVIGLGLVLAANILEYQNY
jgi:hypothetical protein